ncbi:MAG TPA: efflux RND transporter periplasmic adaptor subunit [Opitutaceae bacterium]|nr:efflux RND transporter periplasmic adaptor subunit [Opitutaceae bacterium]
MKNRLSFFSLALLLAAPLRAAEPAPRSASTVVLDETGVKNLRIQTAVAKPGVFEETVFALGRIEVYPGRRAVISSRIPGRALEVLIKHDHPVKKGDVAIVIESRQFSDPPPTINLAAPISGLVSATFVVPGEPVNPDKTLAEILDLTEVYALARVPEHLAAKLKAGQKARITAPAVSGMVFVAELEHLGALADAESGTVEAAFHVGNPALVLRPGMRAEFSIVVSERTGVVSVPRSALQGDPASRFVYVKDFDLPNAFVKSPVVVGQTNDRFVEIISGLLPADEVVTEGAYSLAFAGGGSLSLKAALDAAHGHEHNADGSEIADGQKKAGGIQAHDHGHDHHHSPFWMIVSGVLFVLLLGVGFAKKRGGANPRGN